MATPLDKLIVRESTEIVDERNILVALTDDQRISFRLKGMKSGVVSIHIKQLYEQLSGSIVTESKVKLKGGTDLESILHRLRTMNATTPGKAEYVSRIDGIIVELLNELKPKA